MRAPTARREARLGRVAVRVERVNGPRQPGGGIDPQRPTAVAEPAADLVRAEFDPLLAQDDLGLRGFQRLARLQAELQVELRLLEPAPARLGNGEAERQAGRGRRRYLGLGEEGVVAQPQPVAGVVHAEPAAERDRRHPVLDPVHEGGQLGLVLGVGPGHDQPEAFVVDAQVALAVEGELAVDRRVDQAGEADGPRPGLADAGLHLRHLMGGARQVLRDGCGRAVVVVQGALREAAEVAVTHLPLGEEPGQELGVPAAVGPVGEAEVPPGADRPVAVAAVDRLDRGAVRPGEVLVEVGGAAEGLERRRVAAVFPVQRDAAQGQVVVPGGRPVVGELAPVAVGGLLLGGEAVQGAAAEGLPLLVRQHPPGQVDGGREQGEVVGRGPDVRALVAGEVDAGRPSPGRTSSRSSRSPSASGRGGRPPARPPADGRCRARSGSPTRNPACSRRCPSRCWPAARSPSFSASSRFFRSPKDGLAACCFL